MISIGIVVATAALYRMSLMSRNLIFPLANPTINAYADAMAPASVGVKMPERRPTMIIIGIRSAQNASLKAIQISLMLERLWVG